MSATVTIVGMAAITFLIKALIFILGDRVRFPHWLKQALGFVPGDRADGHYRADDPVAARPGLGVDLAQSAVGRFDRCSSRVRRHAASTVDHRRRIDRLFLLAGLDAVIAMRQCVNTSAGQQVSATAQA